MRGYCSGTTVIDIAVLAMRTAMVSGNQQSSVSAAATKAEPHDGEVHEEENI